MIAIFPKITHYAEKQDYERLACLVRQYFGESQVYSPKIEIKKLISSLGISIGHVVLDNKGAIVAKDEKGRFQVAVVYNPNGIEDNDERFMLAHFLGHFIMHIQSAIAGGDPLTNGFRELILPSARYGQGIMQGKTLSREERQENEADTFAAALLMPVGLVKRALVQVADPEALSVRFGVSYAVMTRRLAQLGLMPDRSAGFLDDEHRLKEEMVPPLSREGQAHANQRPRAQKIEGPANIKKINGILASNNYSVRGPGPQTSGQAAAAPSQLAPSSPTTDNGAAKKQQNSGMERIRQIARKIDMTVR